MARLSPASGAAALLFGFLFSAAACVTLLGATPSVLLAQQATQPPLGANPGALAGRSLVLPGWGQWAQGQRRAWGYGLLEAALWAFWAQRRHSAADLRTAYRDLAWSVARGGMGSRVDGAWAYYETLSYWDRSGSFDSDPSAQGIQPESDPSTYNGSVWALARDLYFRGGDAQPGDPTYEAALAWYQEHAYGEAFLWDWRPQPDALQEYRDLIHRSDNRFQQATNVLGAVLANHLLSATDAYLSSRVPGDAHIRATPAPGLEGQGGLWLTLSWTP